MNKITSTGGVLDAHAYTNGSTPSASQRFAAYVGELGKQYKAYRAGLRLRNTLADLSDAQLLDIGVAEDEITRVRSFERFTPRAWKDQVARMRRSV